jgi:hypothetical protein
MSFHQASGVRYLQGAAGAPATANGNGNVLHADGINGAVQVEVVESNGGTCTLAFQGAFDAGSGAWYGVGYQRVDATASPARTVDTGFSVTANMAHVYQILDPYPVYRAVISSVANSANVSVRAYVIPA